MHNPIILESLLFYTIMFSYLHTNFNKRRSKNFKLRKKKLQNELMSPILSKNIF